MQNDFNKREFFRKYSYVCVFTSRRSATQVIHALWLTLLGCNFEFIHCSNLGISYLAVSKWMFREIMGLTSVRLSLECVFTFEKNYYDLSKAFVDFLYHFILESFEMQCYCIKGQLFIKTLTFRDGLPNHLFPKSRHCLDKGGLTPAWIFFEGFVHMHWLPSKVIIYHQKVIFPHKSVPYSPEHIIQPHLFKIFTLKNGFTHFCLKMSRVAVMRYYGPKFLFACSAHIIIFLHVMNIWLIFLHVMHL